MTKAKHDHDSNMSTEFSQDAPNEALVITRVFDAPRELVWKAWTECEHLMHWWGPKGFTMHHCEIDLRPDGLLLYGMRSPQGQDMWGKFVYREVAAPERLVYINSFSDEKGNTLRHPLSATWPLEVLNTLTLTEQDGKTTLVMRGVPYRATDEEHQTFRTSHQAVQAGFKATLDQLAAYLRRA